MMELIKITESEFGSVVSARDLHVLLAVKSKFADWIKNRIEKYDFIENQDFASVSKSLETGGREIDYAITTDMAKELSMVENNENGKKARRYFIEVDNNKRIVKPVSTLDILEMTIKGLRENNVQLEEVKSEIRQIKETVSNIQVLNAPMEHFSIMGYCRNIKKQIGLAEAKVYGTKCRALCNQMGFVMGKIPDPRFGTVNTYPVDVLKEIIK